MAKFLVRIPLVLSVLFLAALPATTKRASAHPYGTAGGGLHRAVVNSTPGADFVRNADGLYLEENVETMDVPRAVGTPGVTVTCLDVRGINVRPMQIIAENPLSLRGREFQAIGVLAGAIASGVNNGSHCTGTTNGGINKRFYRDGWYCDLGCEYRSSIPGPNIAAGGPYAFQMQRRWNGSNDFVWDLFFQNDNRTVISTLQFESGLPSVGSESSTNGANDTGSAGHQNINMAFNNARSLHMHLFGDPSAAAPGLRNYIRIPWTRADNPHANMCAVNGSFEAGQVVLRGVGRC